MVHDVRESSNDGLVELESSLAIIVPKLHQVGLNANGTRVIEIGADCRSGVQDRKMSN